MLLSKAKLLMRKIRSLQSVDTVFEAQMTQAAPARAAQYST